MKGNPIVQLKFIFVVSLSVALSALAGCATYKTTLTDAQGRTVTCEASGKSGIVTGYYLRRGFEDCVANAKAQGFKEGPQVRSESNGPNSKNPSNPAVNTGAAQ